jgi:energy-coupling factor transporter ATP-binding protein EcfA2
MGAEQSLIENTSNKINYDFNGKNLLICGKQLCGKSTLIKYIYSGLKKEDKDEVFTFSQNDRLDSLDIDLSSSTKRLFVFDDYYWNADSFRLLDIILKNPKCTVILSMQFPYLPTDLQQYIDLSLFSNCNIETRKILSKNMLSFIPIEFDVLSNIFDGVGTYQFLWLTSKNTIENMFLFRVSEDNVDKNVFIERKTTTKVTVGTNTDSNILLHNKIMEMSILFEDIKKLI